MLNLASVVESAGVLLTIATPLVAVPLTVITFYLRSLREHQISRHGELLRRVETVETSVADVRNLLRDFERDFTTKEEWLRECMMARGTLERMREAVLHLEAPGRFEACRPASHHTNDESDRGLAGSSPS